MARGLQAQGFESCPRFECRVGFLTRGKGFLAGYYAMLCFVIIIIIISIIIIIITVIISIVITVASFTRLYQ
ncbi:hypothetical protein E2C01_082812 [Portunus trituberculatus]|uniref:Uncharacterized protein n=1 Tax=Portunus trituberculatus TaxID=210409 RepID=A0A5B7ITB3_PORTR|nr:hypothetical protein [Portunus trituberculatus]